LSFTLARSFFNGAEDVDGKKWVWFKYPNLNRIKVHAGDNCPLIKRSEEKK
jgi:hypothetical protein